MSEAYPLSWPRDWPRVKPALRQAPLFRTELKAALKNLKKQVDMMGGKALVLSSNCTLGDDHPTDPGVVAYFTWQEMPMAVPCDRWRTVAGNVQAIALTLEAMRSMERWGAKHMIRAMFQGFKALPEKTGPTCWEILGLSDHMIDAPDAEHRVTEAFKSKSKLCHPDVAGGSHEAFAALSEARANAVAIIRGGAQ